MMDRRQLLLSAAAALGAATTGVGSSGLWARAQAGETGLLTARQIQALTSASDLMIPRTDTPGAVDAAVPAFVALMISEWASEERRKKLLAAVDGLVSRNILGSDKASARRLARFDARAFGGEENRKDASNYKALKALIVWSYYTSEEGATEELVFEAVPGPFRNVPLSEVGRTWAT